MEEFIRDPEQFRLTNIPSKVYYVPDFITPAEEDCIVARFYDAPKPKWTQLLNRRLQNWGGIPHPKGMIAEPIPEWLQYHIRRIHQLNLMEGHIPNHVLANEYQPGQGIMPHTDGPLFYPTITTISCGSHTVINFTKRIAEGENEMHSILLERRSLFIVQEEMYENYMHSIEEKLYDGITDGIVNIDKVSDAFIINDTVNRQTRISLTIRHVPKTTKIKIKI